MEFINKHVQYLHTKCQYLTLFSAFGSVRPFWTIFFQAKQLTSYEIGIVYSMQPFLSFIAAPMWSYLADRYNKHKPIFIALIAATCGFICLFVFLPPGRSVLYAVSFGIYSIFMSPMFSFLDAQTLLRLEGNKSLYGRQRLWGAVGWGLASLISGLLMDYFDSVYAIFFAFYLFMTMFVLLVGFSQWVPQRMKLPDSAVDDNLTTTINDEDREIENSAVIAETEDSLTVIDDNDKLLEIDQNRNCFSAKLNQMWPGFSFSGSVKWLLQNWRFLAFMVSLMMMAWINMYLDEPLHAPKKLLGVAMVITVVMELPFFFFSKNMLNLIGIAGCTIVGHLALITRSFSYSFLTNPWWVLPIEVTHGIAYSCIWTAGVTYFGQIAPKGREATFQGIFAGIWNVGGGIWSLVGGAVYNNYGPIVLFRSCAVAVACSLALYIISIIGHVPKLVVDVKEYKPVEIELDNNTQEEDSKEDFSVTLKE